MGYASSLKHEQHKQLRIWTILADGKAKMDQQRPVPRIFPAVIGRIFFKYHGMSSAEEHFDVPLRPEPHYLRDQIANWIKQMIDSGIYRFSLPSERKLAEEIAVNRLTVRAALKKLENDRIIAVSGKRRRLILKAEGESLPRLPECTEVVVLSSEALEKIFHSRVSIFEMLRGKLARHGFRFLIEVSPEYALVREGAAFEEMVVRHPNACWLLIRIPPAGQRWFADRKLPAVVMGTPDPGIEIASLDLDYEASCFHAASVFISRGKRRIALIRRTENLIGYERSEAGVRRACEKANVESVIHQAADTPASVIGWLATMSRKKTMPDGIIASDPAIFLSVFSFCYEANLRVPNDLGLICREDDILLDAIRPKVARYRVNDSVLLNRLWRILLAVLRDQVYRKVPEFLMPDYVPGGSAGPSSFL